MSTRAVFTFIGDEGRYSIYKHHDGYPKGAAASLKKALSLSWELPRFESDELAASFVAANKTSQGGVRLTAGAHCHDDLEYEYEIRFEDGEIQIVAFNCGGARGRIYPHFFSGPLSGLADSEKTQTATPKRKPRRPAGWSTVDTSI